MANNPCFGLADCPHCKGVNPVFWNGNFRFSCIRCGHKFTVKRQKLRRVKPYKGPIDA